MIPSSTLALTGIAHDELKHHLFPGDGLEAAALLVCTRTPDPRLRLLVRDVILVPHSDCRRERDSITWPGTYIEAAIDRADSEGLAIFLLHSHPGGLFAFSEADDLSDQRVLPSIFQACGAMHGTAVMTVDGAIRARLYGAHLRPVPVDLVTVAGHNLSYWWDSDARPLGAAPKPMAFTSQITQELARLTATVIGVSGTGSIAAEQVARLGFGRVYLIDFDRIQLRNLNRILNATRKDAAASRLKVEPIADRLRTRLVFDQTQREVVPSEVATVSIV